MGGEKLLKFVEKQQTLEKGKEEKRGHLEEKEEKRRLLEGDRRREDEERERGQAARM